jgi:TLC domain
MRIGLLVLYVHDISDIFVDLLKMINLTKLEGKRGFFLSEIAYVSCIVSWVYYRMWQYPFRVMKGAGPDALSVLGPPAPYSPDGSFLGMLTHNSISDWMTYIGRVHNEIGIAFYVPGHVLLFTLLCLHFYWFHLLFMIGYRIVTESAREASRQEYEGDSEAEDAAGEGNGHRASKAGKEARRAKKE